VGRTGTGATLATLPLTGAAIAAASDKPSLMWALIAVSVVVMLGTVANRLRWLHRLPLIGTPKPVVTFKVNGSSNLTVRLAEPQPGIRPEARTAQIEVEVRNPSSFERIDHALVNFLLPVGLLRKKTDASGNRKEAGGEWLPVRVVVQQRPDVDRSLFRRLHSISPCDGIGLGYGGASS
jgi:hypothetical protein